MALQSSGQISIDDIRTELSSSSGSLRTLSAAAGKSTPDAMSEFYGYSNLKSFSSSTVTTFNGACPFNGSIASLTQTYYHNGTGSQPATGDTCYSDSSGTTPLSAGYYVIGGSSGLGNRQYMQIISGGQVDLGSPDFC